MAVPAVYNSPPRSNPGAVREGDRNAAVASLQRTLTQLDWDGTEDGTYGEQTRVAVTRYQRHRDLKADGIAGQATQTRMTQGWLRDAAKASALPDGLLEGVVAGESGFWLGAVNWSVPGGVDCGAVQRRVYGPPWKPADVQRAFDTRYQARLVSRTTRDRRNSFLNDESRPTARGSQAPSELAWRLAVLAHNWPSAALDVLSKVPVAQWHTRLQMDATWAKYEDDGTVKRIKFDDGQPVMTGLDWAYWYALGSRAHSHKGRMVERAFGLPTY